uniref:Tumor necrosis factor receptor superfamily member 13B-like n=1 Tax=Neolamprologus brichardi TaxID=32507 RepID=A0A3Q4H949_NEOBR
MGGGCAEGQYRDALVGCMDCLGTCQKSLVISRCRSFCEAVNCKTQPGHYYDKLLNKCIECKEICGTHPPESFNQKICPPSFLAEVVAGPSTLKDSDILIYSLLAVCLALLFSSLFLAFVAFFRGGKAKTSNPGSTKGSQSKKKKESEQFNEGLPSSLIDILTSPSCPVNLEPSDDSLPTETCVCVHCFPDMNVRGPAHSRTLRDPPVLYQQAVLQRKSTRLVSISEDLLCSGSSNKNLKRLLYTAPASDSHGGPDLTFVKNGYGAYF